jgi:hypothetical protein
MSAEIDMPIATSGKMAAADIIPPISKILVGKPPTSPAYCSNPARSTRTATASVAKKTAASTID